MVGLGNPGPEYEGTRHNLGADAVGRVAARHDGRLKRSRKERSLTGEVRIGDRRVALAVPLTWMNLSGEAVQLLVRRYDIDDPARIVVVHDELDLEPGRIKVKEGGGLAGHNGLKSIVQHLKSDAFLRVRIGVGKPPRKEVGAHHVLSRPRKREREDLAVTVEEAADAVEMIVTEGVAAAMNHFNRAPSA